MFWIIITLCFIFLTIFLAYKNIDAGLITCCLSFVFSFISLFMVVTYVESKNAYDKYTIEKKQLELVIKTIPKNQELERYWWSEKAIVYNSKLEKEKSIIKRYGNTFKFHNKKILEIEPIDLEVLKCFS